MTRRRAPAPAPAHGILELELNELAEYLREQAKIDRELAARLRDLEKISLQVGAAAACVSEAAALEQISLQVGAACVSGAAALEQRARVYDRRAKRAAKRGERAVKSRPSRSAASTRPLAHGGSAKHRQ